MTVNMQRLAEQLRQRFAKPPRSYLEINPRKYRVLECPAPVRLLFGKKNFAIVLEEEFDWTMVVPNETPVTGITIDGLHNLHDRPEVRTSVMAALNQALERIDVELSLPNTSILVSGLLHTLGSDGFETPSTTPLAVWTDLKERGVYLHVTCVRAGFISLSHQPVRLSELFYEAQLREAWDDSQDGYRPDLAGLV